ncbi:hypothetical protein FD30_GL000122 [Levilactobacillus namurensis DSM 19117]|uniref:Uncharacterized protein n=1 Tax=Levilactobacillus namurensis DSM 19117 TaxID=1423773 RepID=A0A0R1K2N6_9LACO|nr:hypothetical protein FD30_GL000122 [Levilactobacillus namurensis DSM 19117]
MQENNGSRFTVVTDLKKVKADNHCALCAVVIGFLAFLPGCGSTNDGLAYQVSKVNEQINSEN